MAAADDEDWLRISTVHELANAMNHNLSNSRMSNSRTQDPGDVLPNNEIRVRFG